MAKASSHPEGSPQKKSRTLLRLVFHFLPHIHIFAAATLASVVYTTAITGRVLLIYPVMRIVVEANPEAAEEMTDKVPFVRKLTDKDSDFSPFMGWMNTHLDSLDGWMAGIIEPILPEKALQRPGRLEQIASLATLVFLWICMIAVVVVAQWIHLYYAAVLRLRVLIRFREKLLGNLLLQPLGFHNDRERGELISRMSEDVGATMTSLRLITYDMLRHPFALITAVGFIFLLQPWLLLIVLAIVPFVMVSLRRQTRKIRARAKNRQKATARVTEAMVQLFSGIRIVKAFSLEKLKLAEYSMRNRRFANQALGTEKAKASTRVRMELLTHLLLLIGIVTAALVLGAGGTLPAGAFIVFFLMMIQLHRPAKQLVSSYTQLQDSLAGTERMFEFLDLQEAETDAPGAVKLKEVIGGVRFEDVCFSYDDTDQQVLDHINLEVPTGEVVALVGPSGGGKSTLVNLVPRFYEADSGKITIDGTEVSEYTYASLRNCIAVVTQDPFLFNTTIAENIMAGREGATEEDMIGAAKAANIHEFILTLPKGYQTVVGERGAKLSGGQCQRMTIARAILRDAPILILDEATSSLDTESERAVQKALQNLMRGRTTLVIAHRLSTIQHADKICVLSEGRIVDIGSHSELMARDSVYRRLYELQFAMA